MVTNQLLELQKHRFTLGVLLIIILLRLVSSRWLAIYDPTESRYAEIANQMYRSGDWLTPRLYLDGKLEPYWGKPPLHFWLTSLSYVLFGVSEFSSRLPSLLGGIFILIAMMYFAYRIWGMRIAAIAGIVLSSSFLFFVLWGASVVDVTLAAAVTASMVTFALALVETETRASRFWGYAFFVSLVTGMLTKGPIAIALVLLSICLWLIVSRKWQSTKKLPWFGGTLLFFVLSAPWFVAAERATPGFLRYFFVNEHVLRFLVHDYGDKYGSGHVYTRGTTWGMLLIGFLPWTFFLISTLVRQYRNRLVKPSDPSRPWLTYALIWGFTPAIFFTFSRQILATYLLPGFAGLSIVAAVGLAEWLEVPRGKAVARLTKRHVTVSLVGLLVPALIIVGILKFGRVLDSQYSIKPLLSLLSKEKKNNQARLYFPMGAPPSAYFYQEIFEHPIMEHTARVSEADMRNQLKQHSKDVFVFSQEQWDALTADSKKEFVPIEKSGKWIACKEKQPLINPREEKL